MKCEVVVFFVFLLICKLLGIKASVMNKCKCKYNELLHKWHQNCCEVFDLQNFYMDKNHPDWTCFITAVDELFLVN